jgi:DUF4097 and DUF4098 domain-containing protein YvlB
MRRSVRFSRLAAASAVFLSVGALPAWEETLTREGAYWVQTVSGTESAASTGKLRVSTQGRVTVTGGAEEQVRYTFVKKVKARNEQQARRMLGQLVVRSHRQGDLTVVAVAHSGEEMQHAELTVLAPRSLRDVLVETFGGPVEAVGLQGSLQAHTGGGRIKLDRIGGPVVAKTAGGEIILGTIGGSVKCISAGGPIHAGVIRGEARFETAGGDISIQEVSGPVYAGTAGGGIQIGQAGAAVSVNTAGGAIDVSSAQGMVTAESSGGPIQVGKAAGVRCETGGGAIRLSNVSGSMRAATGVGNIIAQLVSNAMAAESVLSTGAGDITVFLPSNLGITILAQNEAAYSVRRIVSDFPGVQVRREGSLIMAEGSINGGGPVLRLTSAGGTIYIKKQQ